MIQIVEEYTVLSIYIKENGKKQIIVIIISKRLDTKVICKTKNVHESHKTRTIFNKKTQTTGVMMVLLIS